MHRRRCDRAGLGRPGEPEGHHHHAEPREDPAQTHRLGQAGAGRVTDEPARARGQGAGNGRDAEAADPDPGDPCAGGRYGSRPPPSRRRGSRARRPMAVPGQSPTQAGDRAARAAVPPRPSASGPCRRERPWRGPQRQAADRGTTRRRAPRVPWREPAPRRAYEDLVLHGVHGVSQSRLAWLSSQSSRVMKISRDSRPHVGAEDPGVAHLIDQPRGAGVADAERALEEAGGASTILEHHGDRLVEHLVHLLAPLVQRSRGRGAGGGLDELLVEVGGRLRGTRDPRAACSSWSSTSALPRGTSWLAWGGV